ncbi:MAG: hypothetical protein CRN43_10475 [Candidatus Nephrothrix sp. EaCA]|nr:MAG: hypothetical protein CRN43_10475 [Candidatus Nephrothrix sp. EaCA]
MGNKLTISAGLVVLIILAVNLVGNEFHLRFDFTEDKEYTLSPATRDILSHLDDAVTVKAYFSQKVPPDIARTRQDFQDLLVEYSNRSGGNVAYTFVDPSAKEGDDQTAIQAGIQPVTVNVREKDQMTQQRAFLGAQLSYRGKTEVIPFVRPGAAMEYALSTAIKKLSADAKPTVGIASGHAEPPIDELAEVKNSLENLYVVKEVPLTDTTDIPADVKTLVITAPKERFTPVQLQKLDAFLQRDGRIFLGLNSVDANFQTAAGTAVNTGLEEWLKGKGLTVNHDFVVDSKCGAINVQQQMAFGMLQQQVPFPYLPIISKFANHPAVQGLESVSLKFASTMKYEGDSTKKFIPLAFTSEKSGAMEAPQYLNYQKQWTTADFSQQRLVVGGAFQGKLAGQNAARMVIIADGDFAVNGAAQERQRLQPDNLNLLVNSVDWLSDDTGLIALRTKGASSRPIKQMEDSTKSILKYANFLLPVLLAVGYGLFRYQQNKMKRLKWMSQNYEKN